MGEPPPLGGDQVNANDRKWTKECPVGRKIHRLKGEMNKLKFLKLLV